jgi:glycosyltransferase involved in cell wall biosynthesis
MGGAERVAEELYRLQPDSTVFATIALKQRLPKLLQDVPVETSWMQRLPFLDRLYRLYFMLYPFGVSALDLSEFDCILSSSSGYAKGVRTSRNAVHVCYCHTPMRWVWNYDKYSERESMGKWLKWGVARAVSALQLWDLHASRQPDHFIANSQAVADRIRKCYGRFSEIIYPPIDVERFTLSANQGEHYLVLSRLVPYKRIDLAIRACNLLNRPLMIIGDGPDREALQKIAGPSITFAGRLSDIEVQHWASECRALLFPGEEDFGLAPLEVAAAGRPTIAYRAGGALETVVEGKTGLFFDETTPESLADAILRFEHRSWSQSALRDHAERFSVEVFQEKMRQFLRKVGVASSAPLKTVPIGSRKPLEVIWKRA